MSILYDFHTHTSGISLCSCLTAAQLCAVIQADGVGGFVLTNHYAPSHCRGEFKEWLHRYEEEYYLAKTEAEKFKLRCLFGMEVSVGREHLLLYGVRPNCLYDSERPLWDHTQEELYHFAHAHGGVLIHAHPYRSGGQPIDPRFLDGVEINCHPLYEQNMEKECRAFAAEHGLILTCGSDYHGDIYKAHCGVYLPEEITDEAALGDYLKKGQPELCVHTIDKQRADESALYRRK